MAGNVVCVVVVIVSHLHSEVYYYLKSLKVDFAKLVSYLVL